MEKQQQKQNIKNIVHIQLNFQKQTKLFNYPKCGKGALCVHIVCECKLNQIYYKEFELEIVIQRKKNPPVLSTFKIMAINKQITSVAR